MPVQINMNVDIGSKVKKLRNSKKMTLKELSEKTKLSIGFLSQMERGITAVATDSLSEIAEALGVDLSYFFTNPRRSKKYVMRSYEKEVFQLQDAGFIMYQLTNEIGDKDMLPRLIELLPNNSDEPIDTYPHEGEEFIYILEGILTLLIDGEHYDLFPGDSAHYKSDIPHNWKNNTNKMVKFLEVNVPAYFNLKQK